MRGRSLIPYLRKESQFVHTETIATGWELFGRCAIRRGDWKALLIPPPDGPGAWQLYNLSVDPGETNDLAQAEPVRLADLLDDWNRYVEETGVRIVNVVT